MKHSIILQVRELLERHLNVFEIASRLGLDPSDVQMAIEVIKQVVS
jgi:DNA-binding MarR family transcriptional regulator